MAERNAAGRRDEYVIEVKFERGTDRPTAPFQAMAQLIDTFRQLDRDLAHSIHLAIEPVVTLTAVEAGSIRSRLTTVLKSVDDDSIKKGDWKGVVGTYLFRAKRNFVEFLEKTPRVSSFDDVQELQGSLLGLAENTGVLQIPTYQPIPARRLLLAAKGISSSVALLDRPSDASLIIESEPLPLSCGPEFSEVLEAELIPVKEITSDIEMVLKVKRPDYLGDAMWDFRHGTTPIQAKIIDDRWLESFRSRLVTLGPGDSLHARVRHTVSYDDAGNITHFSHLIVRVLSVIPFKPPIQQSLLPRE
jgi:hypothetical protein